MSVCFISHLSEMSGAELAMLEAIEGLLTRGVECRVFVPKAGPLVTELESRGVACEVCGFRWWVTNTPRTGLRGLIWGLKIVRYQRQWGREIATVLGRHRLPDVVVTNTVCLAVGAFAARMLGIPHVWYIHEFGSLDHGLRFSFGRRRSLWLMNHYSDAVICNSHAVAEHFSDHINPAKRHVIFYSMKLRETSGKVAAPAPRPDGSFHCVMVGQVAPSKRQEDAVTAVAQLNQVGLDVRLSIIGAGPLEYRKMLDQLIAKYGITKRVEFVPWVRDPAPYMRAADVLLMCSRMEAFGRVTVEAMQLARPVIGARSGATTELIQDGRTGLLFEVANPTDLARKIKLLYMDRDLLARLSASAKTWTEATFREEKTTERIYEVLCEVRQRRRMRREKSDDA